jgi:hypothetical protein
MTRRFGFASGSGFFLFFITYVLSGNTYAEKLTVIF